MPEPTAELAARNGQYSAPALEKGLDVLELLAGAPGLTQNQIATRLGRSASELFRMIDVLERRGYLQRNPSDGTYGLTLLLFELAHRQRGARQLLDAALPRMRELADATGQSNHLVVLHAERILVLAQTDSPGAMGFSVRLGAHFAFRADRVSARVLCAFQSPERRAAMLAGMRRGDPRAPAAASLARRIAQIARRGYEERTSDTFPGITDICFPIIDQAGSAVATLTLPYLKQRDVQMPIDAARAAHAQAAAAISAAMGVRTAPASHAALAKSAARKVPVRRPDALVFKR